MSTSGSQNCILSHAAVGVIGFLGGALLFGFLRSKRTETDSIRLALEERGYSIADQPQRHAKALTDHNIRKLDIDSVYNPSYAKGKIVLVTGGNRGIGYAIAQEYVRQGARVFVTTRQPVNIPNVVVIPDIDVQDNSCGAKLAAFLQKENVKIDILINNAGYFYEPVETLKSTNFEEDLKMIDICAVGPLRITAALYSGNFLKPGESKVVMITSQGGSIAWRQIQNPHGHDYGHHMSKAAANMMGVLVAQELKEDHIPVAILHPGFNKTDMTKKYENIWEVHGAVDSSIGAKRVVHEIGLMHIGNTGEFINVEDGKLIPW